MARSKLQQMMEKDVVEMREQAKQRRDDAAQATADALGLEGQIDNYETLISRAGSFEAEEEGEEHEGLAFPTGGEEETEQLDEDEGF